MKGSALRAVRKDEVPVTDTTPDEREHGWGGGAPLPTVVGRMEQMMEEMFRGGLWGRLGMPWDRLFREVGFGGEDGVKLDMFEDNGTLVVKADLPGIMKENLNIRVIEGNLVLTGERHHEEKIDRKNYLRVERNIGTFTRTIPLPEGVNTEAITATLKDGILEVRIPHTEARKPVIHVDVK